MTLTDQEQTTHLLDLPALTHIFRTRIGRIQQLLRPAIAAEIVGTEEVRVSPRRLEVLYMLDTGERIVVTPRSKCAQPMSSDGVMRESSDGKAQWLSHNLLKAFAEDVSANRLAQRRRQIERNWDGAFAYRTAVVAADGTPQRIGLRAPQIGALHAIGAHWSQHTEPATIVMPTGTGKTETMLAALVAHIRGPLLVIAPSQTLRDQTAAKFMTLGLLRKLELVPQDLPHPIVGVVTKRPKSIDDLEMFNQCNVIVSTMAALGQGTAVPLIGEIAVRVSTLVVDEAHHVVARTWSGFREHFADKRVLQFTATPFRRDGELVDGDVVYTYGLHQAQKDKYFKPIEFFPVHELDEEEADLAVAEAAVGRLKEDLTAGWNHLMMVRCETIERASHVHRIYEDLVPEYEPLLIHSEMKGGHDAVERLRNGDSRIAVCVDMLGEGFDLPELKIAALHDTHKSLAVLLQFTGRFTRAAGDDVGNATVVANIADQKVSTSLDRLYSEDADWNYLLSEFSSQAVREHSELIDFLNSSTRLDSGGENNPEDISISHTLLRPKFSAVVYRCGVFRPKKFHEALHRDVRVHAVWLHEQSETLYFVTRTEPRVSWTRSKEIRDRQWDLFVVHYCRDQGLLFIHSSDKSSLHENIARAVGGSNVRVMSGDVVFRTLGNINRLVFQNIGVRKYGRRNLRYALYTGADVRQALSVSQKSGSVKSNLSGTGYSSGQPVAVGCSYKGRVWWPREQGTVRKFIDWCSATGAKMLDTSIDTQEIIDNVLIPEEVESLPQGKILSLDWPVELIRRSEERVMLKWGDSEMPLSMFDIKCDETRRAQDSLIFRISGEDCLSRLALRVGGNRGFFVWHVDGPQLTIQVGRIEKPLDQYLSDYPPLVRYCDLSELDGNLLIRPQDTPELELPAERFEPWDWSGTNITQESLWKDGQRRPHSIQARAAEHYGAGGFEIIFDDDSSGEAADLVCLKQEEEHIRLALVHCKFTSSEDPGQRVKDVVEVSSQAVRSTKWKWRFRELCQHIVGRERRLKKPYRQTRFLRGDSKLLNRFLQASRFKQIRAEIVVVQPGVSRRNCSAEQTAVLAAACCFLKETSDVDLDIVCSE